MGAPRVSDEDRRAILARIAEGKTYPEIAKEFGRSTATVYNIKKDAMGDIPAHAQTSCISNKVTKDFGAGSGRANIRAFISKVKNTKAAFLSAFGDIYPGTDAEYEIAIDHTEETVLALQGMVTRWNGGQKPAERNSSKRSIKYAEDQRIHEFIGRANSFIVAYENDMNEWLVAQPDLSEEDKQALGDTLHACANSLSKIAQALI